MKEFFLLKVDFSLEEVCYPGRTQEVNEVVSFCINGRKGTFTQINHFNNGLICQFGQPYLILASVLCNYMCMLLNSADSDQAALIRSGYIQFVQKVCLIT